jgi:hypothetical protein
VLRHSRVIVAAGLGAAILLADGAAPGASAHPASAAARAIAAAGASSTAASAAVGKISAAGLPASAKDRITSGMLKAWQITKGDGVIVAVLSTHVDSVTGLSGKLITGPVYAPEASAPAVVGTVLSSVIAGSGPTSSDAFGTVGRAPAARILALQIVDYGGGHAAEKYQRFGTWDVLEAKAIRYAARHGAKVIVIDESGYETLGETYPRLASAVAYALSRNVIIVGDGSIWGTSGNTQLKVPDDLPGVINYSGTVLSGLPAPPHQVRTTRTPANPSVLVTAPSNVLAATGPANEPYTAFSTIASKAWVAGTVALIKSVYPRASPALVQRALAISASYRPAGGYSRKLGFGLINPDGALHAMARLMKLRKAAQPGGVVQDPAARFGAAAPSAVTAVHHSPAKLGLYGGAIVMGVILLLLALIQARRGRLRPHTAVLGGSSAQP